MHPDRGLAGNGIGADWLRRDPPVEQLVENDFLIAWATATHAVVDARVGELAVADPDELGACGGVRIQAAIRSRPHPREEAMTDPLLPPPAPERPTVTVPPPPTRFAVIDFFGHKKLAGRVSAFARLPAGWSFAAA